MTGRDRTCDAPRFRRALYRLELRSRVEAGWNQALRKAFSSRRGAVVERARELLRFARAQGYKPDELVEILQQLEMSLRKGRKPGSQAGHSVRQWAEPESNRRPPPYQRGALPPELSA